MLPCASLWQERARQSRPPGNVAPRCHVALEAGVAQRLDRRGRGGRAASFPVASSAAPSVVPVRSPDGATGVPAMAESAEQ